MKELLDHMEYAKLFMMISLGMVALTYLVHIIFRRARFMKYLPGLISILIGAYAIFTVDGEVIFLDDIDNITIFIISVAVGFVGIGVALIIGIFNKGKKRKRKKNKKRQIEKSEKA